MRLFCRNIKLKLPRNVPNRHKGDRDIALSLFDPGAKKGVGRQRQDPAALPPGKRLVTTWVGFAASLELFVKSRPQPDSNLGLFGP